jgi:carbon storage regulator
MLVIRRRAGEVLLIGEDVEIEILDCTSSHVKLGIRAPQAITVLRKEIHVTGEQNRASATQATAAGVKRLLGTLR